MGYSFNTSQVDSRENLQQFGRRVPETARSYLPRSAWTNQSEDIDLIRDGLDAEPSGDSASPEDHPSRKRLSALSRTNSQGKKRALDILSISSRPIRRLLQSRSASPAPSLRKNIAQQETATGVRYCQIVQDQRKLTNLENPSASRVNCRDEFKTTRTTKKHRSVERKLVMSVNKTTTPPKESESFLGPQSQLMDSDGLGWEKEHPDWVAADRRNPSPQRLPVTHDGDASSKPIPSPRHKVGPIARGSAHKDFAMSFEPRSMEPARQAATRSPLQTQALNSRVPNPYPAIPSSHVSATLPPGPLCQPNSAPSKKPQDSSPLATDAFRQPSCQEDSPHRSSTSVDSRTSFPQPPQPSTSISVAKGAVSEPSSGAAMNAPQSDLARIRQPPNPGPAPTGPLPPVPQNRSSASCKSSDSGKEMHESDDDPERLRTTILPKTSVRWGQPMSDVIEDTNPTNLPIRVNTFPCLDEVWPRPPQSLVTRGVHSPKMSEALVPAAFDCEDTFGFKKRLEKSEAAKRRHLGQARLHPGITPPADGEGLDGQPRTEARNDSVISLPRHTDTQGSKDLSLKNGLPGPPAQGLNATRPSIERNGGQHSVERRIKYRNHGTQYSPPRREILISPPGSPTLLVFDDEGNQSEKTSRPSLPRRMSSKRSVEHSDVLHTERAESLAWYLADLESRIETRMLAFERRTMLLEAALLAVINTSANFAAEERSSNGHRSSGLSERSEKYSALESKLEAMITSMNACRRPSANA